MKKEKNKILFLLLATLIIMLIIYFIINKPEYYFPKRENYNVYGIDLSYYQGDQIEWDTLLYGNDLPIEFVFLKASEGITLQDKMFEEYSKELIKRNVCFGAYHYFVADISGSEQAKNFLNSISNVKVKLPYVIDIEKYTDRDVAIKNLNTFIQTINNEKDHEIMIYTNVSTYYDLIVGNDLDHLPLWIASYRIDEPQLPKDFLFWQYTDRGRLKGINTKIDLNVFNGSYNGWIKYKKACGCQ
jgi:lysozyme